MNFTTFVETNAEKFLKKPALGFKKDIEWKEINWLLFRTIVYKTANALRENGIKENDKVAIYSENCAEWICLDLAVMALGAVTVPIYSTNNREQTEYILNDSEAKIILVGNQEQYDVAFEIVQNSEILEKIIVIKKSVWIKKEKSEYLENFIKSASEKFEIVDKKSDDLATLIYTSGTTGVPKGVMLTHGNFQKCVDAHFDFFKFDNFVNEHSLAFLPLTHVFERSWTLLCLYGGAKVSFLENPKLIAHALTEVKPSLMCSVPRFYQKIYGGIQEMLNSSSASKKKIFNWAIKIGGEVAELKRNNKSIPLFLNLKNSVADAMVFSKIKKKLGGNLWFVASGGASISPEVTQFFDAMGIHITVGYGLTETTATLTAFPFKNYEHGSAGKPLGNTQIKIGENDEILAKGDGIMKGYYNKPEETAQVFTVDGWFRTGDAGEFDDKGNLIITDRIKDLMKTSNGKYIAPQPIENLLSNNNYIQQIMVIAEGKPFVSALVVPNFEFLQEKIKELNIPFTDWKSIVEMPIIKDLYKEKIDEAQHTLSGVEKVKKFVLMPCEFEISSGEITPTLKIKRNIVIQKYQTLIEGMYA
jgi:long-chain acyl-CoA synthetase